MLRPIPPGQLLPVIEVLLHRGINDQLLADGMPRQFPDELVPEAGLLVWIGRGDDQLVEGLDLAVVVLDCVDDAESARLRPVCEGLDLVAYVAAEDVRFGAAVCGHDSGISDGVDERGRCE